jgi:outer membrane protein assembly factor BamB
MKKNILAIGLISLFIFSTISPIVIGNNISVINSKKYTINRNEYPVPVDNPSDGLIESAWPMKCHDLHHTGRSPYGTANTSYYELWNYKLGDKKVDTDPSIGKDGTIYVGGSYENLNCYLYALNPNGNLKWRYRADGFLWYMCPSIAEDGTIYFGSWDDCLHAVNPDGTRKWKYNTNNNLVSDPTIGEDGTIYFGAFGGDIFALNPNGTKKWQYKTGGDITSAPAIADDGTIYIGSRDNYLYAMNPNGTLKWRYKTGDWVRSPPSIADDGTIYFSSYDKYLYALYPDNTLRWKTGVGSGCDTNPSIGSDGTIYLCAYKVLYAICPEGSIKWTFNLGGKVVKSSPAICADGIIYTGIEIGNMNGGEIVAVNPDGTLRWRQRLSNKWVDSSPCIGEDGIIYIVSSNDGYSRLHAFGTGGLVECDVNGPYYGLINISVDFSGSALYGYPPYIWSWDFGDGNTSDEQNPSHVYNSPGRYTVTLTVTDQDYNVSENVTWATIQESNIPPDKPVINGPRYGVVDEYIVYTFKSVDSDDNELWYYLDWGDSKKNWFGWYESGEEVPYNLWWYQGGVHTIRAKSRDGYGAESDWVEYRIFIPRIQQSSYQLYDWFLNRFPLIFKLLGLYL